VELVQLHWAGLRLAKVIVEIEPLRRRLMKTSKQDYRTIIHGQDSESRLPTALPTQPHWTPPKHVNFIKSNFRVRISSEQVVLYVQKNKCIKAGSALVLSGQKCHKLSESSSDDMDVNVPKEFLPCFECCAHHSSTAR
jgi:hypothetical protein